MDTALHAVRFIHYAAALQLFGVAVFQWAIAPAPLRRQLEPLHRPLAVWSAWLQLMSALVWLALTAASMGGSLADAVNLETVLLVLSATTFGRVWSAVLGLSLLLVIAISRRSLGTWLVPAILSGVSLCCLGLIGHATIGEGLAGVVNRGSTALHILASSFWVGSLLPLISCLRVLPIKSHGRDADMALLRFSAYGHLAVALVVATGVVNGVAILGGAPLDLSSPYQGLLLTKILLVGVMLGLAIVNRYVFVPAIASHGPGLSLLRQGTIAEIVLTGGVLAVVSVLGVVAPQ